MNFKNYESFFSTWILFFLFVIFFIMVFIYSISVSNIRKYQMITGLVSSKNQVMIFVSSDQLKWLYHNQTLLINGKRTKFSIDRKLDVERSKNKYQYQVFLSVSTRGYSVNSSIFVGLLYKKVSFLSVFFDMWGGD